ncbi:hypothetical protein FOZ76_02425 [Verticiella sediminum]|uniref:Uncharacterized protein n=1 Tax=Verticiella sediminum TaxID=1247510 RepID=A0A556B0B3_9BURK|nr:hypothetical protein [Verticiella sediminum]TSH98627.1 hypothetical protein FOZ76_02425 [Verticiella sediminum]
MTVPVPMNLSRNLYNASGLRPLLEPRSVVCAVIAAPRDAAHVHRAAVESVGIAKDMTPLVVSHGRVVTVDARIVCNAEVEAAQQPCAHAV